MTFEFKKFENNNNPNAKILSIKITNKCNLTCPYCYEDARKELDNEITLEDIKKIIDIVNPVNSIDFTGGECLTKYDLLVAAKDYAFTKVNRLRIATNGTIPINFRDFYPLPKGKSLVFSISLDGFEEDHDKNRGKGTFQKTLDFSRELIQRGIPIIASSVVPEYYYDNNGELLKKFHNFLINFGFIVHMNAVPSLLGRNQIEENLKLKLKSQELCSKLNIIERSCFNCAIPYFKKGDTPRTVPIDSQGYIRPFCQLLDRQLFHYTEYSNEKYAQEMNRLFHEQKYGYKNGIWIGEK
jgi:MoaA/NifB/PqqE/SkfB family radical SAM enzyme